MINKIIVVIICMLCFVSFANADILYMANNPCSGNTGWGNGSNSTLDGTNKLTPFLSFNYALSQMSAGDTLIIDDGIYTGSVNTKLRNDYTPYGNNGVDGIDGTADDIYTVFKAENSGRVIFQGAEHVFYGDIVVDGYVPSVYPPVRFIEIRGFIYKNNGGNLAVGYTKYIKVIDCGFTDNGGPKDSGTAQVNAIHTTHVLFENCYSWGESGYYFFWNLHCEFTIMRNCVVRFDRCSSEEGAQNGGISNYSCKNIEVQNCIVIDGDTGYGNLGWYSGTQGCFANPASTSRLNDDYAPNLYNNNIALNCNQRYGTSDQSIPDPPYYRSYTKHYNSVGYDLVLPPGSIIPVVSGPSSYFGASGSTLFDQCTFMLSRSYNGAESLTMFYGTGTYNDITNTIIDDLQLGDLAYQQKSMDHLNITNFDSGTYSYNTSGFPQPTSMSEHTISKQYIPIMTTTALKTAGVGGKRIGAEILYQYGKSGTIYGQDGYDKLQDGTDGQAETRIWPYPNQDIMKEYMSTYAHTSGTTTNGIPYDAINGKRGFCADGKQLNGTDDITLTSYIWEYLGNEMPTDIYGPATNPTVLITPISPTTESSVEITGSITAVTATTITGATCTGGHTVTLGSPTGLVYPFSVTVPLVVGDNTFTIEATDSAANTGSSPITITRTAVPSGVTTISATGTPTTMSATGPVTLMQ